MVRQVKTWLESKSAGVIITNNYKDYRLMLGAQIIKPSKVRTIAR